MTRHIRAHRPVQPEPIPIDIRMMEQFTRLFMLMLGLISVTALVWWLVRLPVFAIAGITLAGQVEHNNAITIRANVTPQLRGNFFTFDLPQTQKIFETVPWIRHAVVEREFPNRLRVLIEEQQPAGYWGTEGEGRLINQQGEVFDANWGELEDANLPHLSGPDNQAAQVLDIYRLILPLFKEMGLPVVGLNLSTRGSWQAKLSNGALVELGRGSNKEIEERVRNFTSTLAQVSQRYERRVSALESADLRHENGYALKLKGLTTVDLQPVKR